MLLVESRVLEQKVEGPLRVLLLERLQEGGLVPLVRSARLHALKLALTTDERVHDIELELARQSEAEEGGPYVRGDLFCFEDFTHFIIFGANSVTAGIVYEPSTEDAPPKLDAFCRNVSEAVAAVGGGTNPPDAGVPFGAEWRPREPREPESYRRFAAERDESPAARGEVVAGWLRAAGMLEDSAARRALQRMSDAHAEGHGGVPLSAAGEALPENMLNKFTEVGLLRREILVSCRQDGRPLFRLPSPEAFSVLSGSSAVCSECGAAIADEKAEEISVPTPLTDMLLQDGAWLATHLRSVLVKLGVPQRQIATRTAAGDGLMRLMANVCGESFLFLLRDGDWASTHTRHALEELARPDAPHLVVVATGAVHEEARQRLRELARRRARGGEERELIFVEGMEALASELQPAFERASARALAAQLWELDASFGLSVVQLLAARARLRRQKPEGLGDLAASAAAGGHGEV